MPKNIQKIAYMPKTENRTALRIRAFIAALSVMGLCFVFSLFIKYQYERLLAVEKEISDVSVEIDRQNALTQSLIREKSMQGTAEYYEKIARERLGLTYKNQIFFKRK